MTNEQALRWWQAQISDDWWQSQMPITLAALDDAMQYSQKTAYHALVQNRALPRVLRRLARIIPKIESREIIFPPPRQPWKPFRPCYWRRFVRATPRVLFLDLPAAIPAIGKISPESIWTIFAQCSSCGGNKFLPLSIHGDPNVACIRCFPPSQYPSIGGVRTEKSLVYQMIRIQYPHAVQYKYATLAKAKPKPPKPPKKPRVKKIPKVGRHGKNRQPFHSINPCANRKLLPGRVKMARMLKCQREKNTNA